MGRTLALDLGEKRVGVAVSDPLGITAQGQETLVRRGGRRDIEGVAELVRTHGAERVVIGLPLMMDGREGPAATRAREFAADLSATLGIPVDTWDERLTTAEVERVLISSGMRRSRRRDERDRLAAVVLLQSWLDAHPARSTAP
jgi:putative Holliday junction resolvase